MEEGLFVQISANYLFNILSSFLILFLANTIYKIKPNIKSTVVFILAHAAIITATSRVSTVIFSNIELFKLIRPFFILAITIISVKFLLKIYFKQSIIICSINTLIMGLAEIIIYLLMQVIGFNPKDALHGLLAYALSNLSIYITASIIVLSIKSFNLIHELPRNIRPRAYKYILVTILISIVIVFSFAIITFSTNSTALFLIFIIAVLTNIYINFYSIYKIAKIDISEQDLELQKFYNQSMAEVIDSLRMYKHDTGNMLNTINGYLALNKFDKLSEYIREHMSDMDSTNNLMSIGNIKNAALYGIVSSKIHKARKLGVNMQVTILGEINEINNIRITHLCEILGIYLDNAIEACNQNAKKIVNLIMKSSPDSTRFIIENTYNNEILDKDNLGQLGFSTKGEGHGTGLYIVKKLLANNERVINNTSVSQFYFTQELIIKNN